MSFTVTYKDRERTYEGPIEQTGTRATTHWDRVLHGFKMPDIYASTHTWYLDPTALAALVAAQNELLEEDFSIVMVDAYRTYEQQAEAHKNKPDLAVTPEQSKHTKGFAADLRMWDSEVGDFDADDEDTWGDQDYLAEVLAKHGWKRTVMPKEPWHFDYTG